MSLSLSSFCNRQSCSNAPFKKADNINFCSRNILLSLPYSFYQFLLSDIHSSLSLLVLIALPPYRLGFFLQDSHRRHFRQYHYQGRDKSFGYFYDLQDTASTPFRLPRSMKYSDVFPIHLLCHFPTGCWRNFLFLRNKIAIRLHFLKSYSFAINNI